MVAAATRKRPSLSFAAFGCVVAFSDILDGDEAYATPVGVNHDQFLDTMDMQEPAGLFVVHPLADRHHLAGHEIGDRLARIVGEAQRRDW